MHWGSNCLILYHCQVCIKFHAGAQLGATRARIFVRLRCDRDDGPPRQHFDDSPRSARAHGSTRVTVAPSRKTAEHLFDDAVFERVKADDHKTPPRL